MATVGSAGQGITPRDLTGYRRLLETEFRAAFGPDLDLAPETPQGQIIGILALRFAEVDEALVDLAQATAVDNAAGGQLDALAGLLHVVRRGAEHSAVTLTLTGEAGTEIAAGLRVRTLAGVEFRTASAALIPAAGTVTVAATATVAGALAAPAGTLTTIVTPVAGLLSATNASDATLGRLAESDAVYRARYRAATARLAASAPDAIRAAVIDAGATDVRVEVNDAGVAATRQGTSIPAHAVAVIADGGTDAAVAAALARVKTLGVATTGAVNVNGTRFARVAPDPVAVAVSLRLGADFPAAGLAEITDRLVAYAAATWGIGEGVDVRRLQTPINAVAGHTITALTVTRTAGGGLPATTPLARRYTLAAEDVAVTLV